MMRMKIVIILNSKDSEPAWNAFRFGIASLEKGHSVKVFLLGNGVECESLQSKKFNVQKVIGIFKKRNGLILACGTCLKSRQKKGRNVCPISTMAELLKLVEDSDKILTFG